MGIEGRIPPKDEREATPIEPLLVRWGEPFTIAPDFSQLPTRTNIGDYHKVEVPIALEDGTARGNMSLVLFGIPHGGRGFYFEGMHFPQANRSKRASLPASVEAELVMADPVGSSDVRLSATLHGLRYTANRTSQCGAIPKASTADRLLYYSHWNRYESGMDPERVATMDLYLPQDPSAIEGVQFQFDRFFVDGRYYSRYPATNTALRQRFHPSITFVQ